MGLPNFYLHECGTGGGVFTTGGSESILIAVIAARYHAIKRLKKSQEEKPDNCFLPKLVMYFSEDAHSCIEKTANICMVKKRKVETDECFRLTGCALEKVIKEDIAKGLVPFMVISTMGSTSTTACDKISEIAEICQRYPNIWLHIDAAYGGNTLICPEFRYLVEGIECSDSFNCNPHKLLNSLVDCAAVYFKDVCKVKEAMHVCRHTVNSEEGDDYGDWSISLSRRLRGLKLWYVLRSYGIEGLQHLIRAQCCLAKCFKTLVKQDERFEILNDVKMGLVCFRLREGNEKTKQLFDSISKEGQIILSPTVVKQKQIIRLCITNEKTEEEDIHTAWNIIKRHADKILKC
ncbi:hypothetical protein L9F63_003046 [Diploptera punctata]|uniref:Uncharacterized protein n=1 Tax=Diploptera punctata TaxID=6984 RepID=A0AAD7ZQT2_DIPPU|nr:hypothetical protein L9F63_003046 [Diploptera punctata]